MSTSFRQFDYCSLCKLSHKKRKKHIYSKRHQETLTNILKKFRNKILTCLSSLDTAEVFEVGWETGAKFWCYFCEVENAKHSVLEDCTVKNAGFLQHLCSADHLSKTQEFFWKHLIDKKKKSDFILKLEDFQKFTESQDVAVQTFRQNLLTRRLQETENIRRQVYKRKLAATNRLTLSAKTYAHEQPNSFKRSKLKLSEAGSRGKATLTAFGNGLAFVEHKQVDDDEGNIFSDAVPPWLKDDVDVSKKDEIGPSMDEYQKELNRERKRKLPTDRVGANFDRNTMTELNWLPSFGRVWNQGRRLNSKNQFQRNMKRNRVSSTGSNGFFDKSRQSHAQTGGYERKHPTPAGVMTDRFQTDSFQMGHSQMKTAAGVLKNSFHMSSTEMPHCTGSPSETKPFVSETSLSTFPSSTFVPYKRKELNSEKNNSDVISQLIVTPVLQNTSDGQHAHVNGRPMLTVNCDTSITKHN